MIGSSVNSARSPCCHQPIISCFDAVGYYALPAAPSATTKADHHVDWPLAEAGIGQDDRGLTGTHGRMAYGDHGLSLGLSPGDLSIDLTEHIEPSDVAQLVRQFSAQDLSMITPAGFAGRPRRRYRSTKQRRTVTGNNVAEHG